MAAVVKGGGEGGMELCSDRATPYLWRVFTRVPMDSLYVEHRGGDWRVEGGRAERGVGREKRLGGGGWGGGRRGRGRG